MAANLPFLIVRREAKDYGTSNRLEGICEEGERVVVVEDVVTSGGAALDAVRALRQAGLLCDTVICVVDRGEGGAEAGTHFFARVRVSFSGPRVGHNEGE